LKRYEIESLLKSFFIFFTLLVILLCVIIFQNYKQGLYSIDDQIRSQMKICSFDLKCEGLEVDFVSKTEKTKLRQLYKDGAVYSFFDIPTVDDYLLKITLPQKDYKKRISLLQNELFKKFIFYTFLIGVLSFLFSLYALRPLKKALDLNEEFVKDILHDINTPLSSLIINFKLFKKEIGENRKIERMESSVSTIVSLQNNLKSFLDNSLLQKEKFDLFDIVNEKIKYFKMLYPYMQFKIKKQKYLVFTNKDALSRILDNLINNACKYSKKDATISIRMDKNILYIKDDGYGIKNIKKVFNRFYKENQRGVGIGMHIVKKLCDELKIDIVVKSKLEVGTTISLDFTKVILK